MTEETQLELFDTLTQEQFNKHALRTEAIPESLKINKTIVVNLMKAFMELGNLLDGVKKAAFYGDISKYEENAHTHIHKIQHFLKIVHEQPTKGEFVLDETMTRIFHGSLGKVTEDAEIFEAIFEGFQQNNIDLVDLINLGEEIYDGAWYDAILIDAVKLNPEKQYARIINKLRERYPEKFTEENAKNRSLESERKILES